MYNEAQTNQYRLKYYFMLKLKKKSEYIYKKEEVS